MRAKSVGLVMGTLLALTLVSAAGAITFGNRDTAHPYVGLIAFWDDGGNLVGRCSGELLSPRVFLASGHCASDPVTGAPRPNLRVWFEESVDITYPGGGYTGTLVFSPDGALAIVQLSATPPVLTFPTLPAVGVVDTLANKTALDLVGYGVTEQEKVKGHPIGRWNDSTDRMVASSALVSGKQSTSADLLKHSNGPGGDSGGNCFHDSGGPLLLGGTHTLLAISYAVTNYNCTGVAYGTRLDTQAHLDWIANPQ
jgi:hypothetical protein